MYQKPEDVKFYDSGEPIPDGHVIIIFKDYPFEDVYAGNRNFKLRLDMEDYEYFAERPHYFLAKNRHEGIIQKYPWHNIVYIETQTNSTHYVKAFNARNGHAIRTMDVRDRTAL